MTKYRVYNVVIPIAGHAYVTVEAENEQEAIELAMDDVSLSDVEDWEPLGRFVQGNVCNCPSPWEAEATAAAPPRLTPTTPVGG